MATDSNSIGSAISLQGQPKMYEDLFAKGLERSANQKALADRAREKKQADDSAKFQTILDKDFKIDPSKYHPFYMPQVNDTLKSTFNDILQTRRENPDNWGNMIMPKLMKMTQDLGYYQQQSAAAKQVEKDVFDGKVYSDPDFVKSINNPANYGKPDKVKFDPNNVYGTAMNPDNGAISYSPVKKVDINKQYIEPFKKDPNNWTDYSIEAGKVPGAPYTYSTTTKKVIKGDNFDGLNAAVTTNPDNHGDYVARHAQDYAKAISSGEIKKDANGNIDPESRAAWTNKGLNYELSTGVGNGTDKITSRTIKPMRDASKKDNKTQVVTPSNSREITTNDYSVTRKTDPATGKTVVQVNGDANLRNETGSVWKGDKSTLVDKTTPHNTTTQGSYTFSPVTIDYAPSSVHNMVSGHTEKVAGPSTYQISSVDKLPYTLDKTGNPVVIYNDALSKNKDVKYGWFAVGIDKAGVVGSKINGHQRAIPLDKGLYEKLTTNPKGKVELKEFNSDELFGSGTVSNKKKISGF